MPPPPLYSILRGPWLLLRGALELIVSRERLDGLLDRLGFFRAKDRLSRSVRTLPDGTRLLHRPDDQVVIDEIHGKGWYSRPTIADGDTVVDAGAHIGVFAVSAAKRTPKGRVIAIEPAESNLEFLRENLRLNGLSNVAVVPCALSDRPGEGRLSAVGEHALFTLHPASPDAVSVAVRLRTLDEVFAAEGISVCALLKIDVEAAELEVLEGGREALKATRQVLLEATKEGGLDRRCAAALEAAGFSCSVAVDTPGGVVLYARR